MAVCSAVRLRLQFDYPPPSEPQHRLCWILLDPNRCRVIADLSTEIRERFCYSRTAQLHLYLQDSYLPPAENIHLIRDNDCIRVKVSTFPCVGSVESVERGNTKKKKRCREEEEEEQAKDGGADAGPNKKSKSEKGQINGVNQAEETKTKENKKKKKKKKKKEVKQVEAEPEPEQAKEPLGSKTQSGNSSKKVLASSRSNGKATKTSRKQSDSSDSSEETPEKPLAKSKPTPKPKPKPQTKPAVPAKAKESSSSESSSSDDDALPPVRPPPIRQNSKTSTRKPSAQPEPSSDSSSSSQSPPPKKTPPSTPVHNGPPSALFTPVVNNTEKNPQTPDSDSSSETELVIRTPNPQVLGMTPRGRGRGRGGGRGSFGRARGTPWKQNFHYNYESGERRTPDSLTNKSLLLENPPEPGPKPRRDYGALPLLAAPPAAGQKIAFKLLELTENYTPEVSDYKEGQIIGFNPTSNMVELELITQTQVRAEPGKFDLVYQNPDGSERVEYAVTLGSQVTERWDSLLEPRLIVENTG